MFDVVLDYPLQNILHVARGKAAILAVKTLIEGVCWSIVHRVSVSLCFVHCSQSRCERADLEQRTWQLRVQHCVVGCDRQRIPSQAVLLLCCVTVWQIEVAMMLLEAGAM